MLSLKFIYWIQIRSIYLRGKFLFSALKHQCKLSTPFSSSLLILSFLTSCFFLLFNTKASALRDEMKTIFNNLTFIKIHEIQRIIYFAICVSSVRWNFFSWLLDEKIERKKKCFLIVLSSCQIQFWWLIMKNKTETIFMELRVCNASEVVESGCKLFRMFIEESNWNLHFFEIFENGKILTWLPKIFFCVFKILNIKNLWRFIFHNFPSRLN